MRPERLRLAYLVAPVRAEHLQDDSELRAIMAAAYATVDDYALRTFTDEDAAVSWLQGKLH